ncbi:MAG: hypothetical protein MZV63_62810 [Marinilabiliales bacterium]|nr:hypothetical protein [Marinilabiliales bacterium]
MESTDIIREILESGLRGRRAAADSSTGKKWEIVASKFAERKVICNGDEGDPGAFHGPDAA